MAKIKPFHVEKAKEVEIRFNPKNRKYEYLDPSEEGKPAFERCIENPWIADKIVQANPLPGQKLFDFGCNKARYLLNAERTYNLKTYGVDIKEGGADYVEKFYKGMFNKKIKRNIRKDAPFDIATSISSVEHAGCKWHPDEARIRNYQMEICEFLMSISDYFFLSVPYGRRPGWAEDKSRKNLYQFDSYMFADLIRIADKLGKDHLCEYYKLDVGYWSKALVQDVMNCRYRGNKQGATAIGLFSMWGK